MANAAEILDEIRRHFAAHPRGMVQVTTMTRATRYRSPDWFRVSSKGNLQVRRGRTWDTISLGGSPLVGIRMFNPSRKKKRKPTGGDWQPDLFGGRGIERGEGLTRAEQLELARQEMRQTGSRDLFDFMADQPPRRNPRQVGGGRFRVSRVSPHDPSWQVWDGLLRRYVGQRRMTRRETERYARELSARAKHFAEPNPTADTPEMRYQRAVGHGERLSTARKAAANPGRATGRMAPNCPMCGALVRLPNPIPPRVTCQACGTASLVRRP